MLSRHLINFCLLAFSAFLLTACQAGGGATGDAAPTAFSGSTGAPTPAELIKQGPLGDKVFGKASAPVTVIEYASLTCRYCREFHLSTYPKLKKAYIETGKVRYIIREFPIGRSAAAAAVVTRCAPAKDYLRLYDKYLVNQKQWTSQEVRPDALFKVAAQTGMSRKTFDKCMTNQGIVDGLMWVKQRGRQFGVAGTPTFFINGQKVRGVLTFEKMKGMIEPQISARAANPA
jgi:protein-disulfide isomerase